MSRKSHKNHLNLMLPSQKSDNHDPAIQTINNNLNNSIDITSHNLESHHLSIPSIVQEVTLKNDILENDYSKMEIGRELIDNSLLTPSPIPSCLYFNNLTTDCNHGIQKKNLNMKISNYEINPSQKQQLINFQIIKQKIGDITSDDMITLEELGKGNGGVVTKVMHKPSNQIIARKNIHLEIKPAIRTQIMRELQVLHDCNSPYIVGYYGSYHVETEISICMEYMDGGSLDLILKVAGRLPEPIVAHITCSVLKGLIYLRKVLHIIHRDVKPSNILVNLEGDVKLCDFGVSGRLIDSMANSFVGTRSYMAPERLTGEQYNTLSDVWSLGLTLTELGTGVYPIPAVMLENFLSAFKINKLDNFTDHLNATFDGTILPAVQTSDKGPMAIFELLSYIVDYPPPILPEFCFSANFLSFTNYCLRKEPSERLSLEMLEQHHFVMDNPVKNIYLELNKNYKTTVESHQVLVGKYIKNILLLK